LCQALELGRVPLRSGCADTHTQIFIRGLERVEAEDRNNAALRNMNLIFSPKAGAARDTYILFPENELRRTCFSP
jgi:hypothetical protein